jgi:hypothetical protein
MPDFSFGRLRAILDPGQKLGLDADAPRARSALVRAPESVNIRQQTHLAWRANSSFHQRHEFRGLETRVPRADLSGPANNSLQVSALRRSRRASGTSALAQKDTPPRSRPIA